MADTAEAPYPLGATPGLAGFTSYVVALVAPGGKPSHGLLNRRPAALLWQESSCGRSANSPSLRVCDGSTALL
jgi:hypothetical protein